MPYADFARLLKQAMGLDPASIGSSAIVRAVRQRELACELHEPGAYLALVSSSAAELQALIEAVAVPETWFFRDREAFAALARLAREDWLASIPQGSLRLLSVPCSGGEEPYSMAMALLDAGFPAAGFRIDAVDISEVSLARALKAVYRKNSFRGGEQEFRQRHFRAEEHGYRLSDAVREQVHFRQGNLLAADFLSGTQTYDMIFCRNLLIYFDRDTQDHAIRVLHRLLAAKGVLFVAPSETGLMFSHEFISANESLAFAFRKSTGALPPSAPPRSIRQRRAGAGFAPAPVTPRPRPEPAPAAVPATTFEPEMDRASNLADQGHLDEAARACTEHLRKHGPSAQAFHLLGLIRAAAGNPSDAGQFYRKALYLDQNHHATLVHLALLLEQQGDPAGARLLRERVLRLPQKATS
jgi:chemotaxis protein methyltransferase WspC